MERSELEARDLFRALELAHYAERFRDDRFVAVLPAGVPFREVLLDVKVLTGYHIRLVLACHESAPELESSVELANKRGARFRLIPMAKSHWGTLLSEPSSRNPPYLDILERALAEGETPLLAPSGDETSGDEPAESAIQQRGRQETPRAVTKSVDPALVVAGEVALHLNARKLFLLDPLAGDLMAAHPRSSVHASELDALAESLPGKMPRDKAAGAMALCAFIAGQLARGTPDVVVLEPRGGQMFREAFSYEGAGLLCNATRESRIRRGALADMTDIGLLLRPEVEAGRILTLDEDEIEANIDNYWLYEMDGQVVGLACLKPHGEEGELAHFATLPRFRGKGRARELAQHLVESARKQGLRKVFALSIDERMWDFFKGLGFKEIERECLPKEWRRSYDFSRPSRAFKLTL